MTYEDELCDALERRARQLDARRPTFDADLGGSSTADKREPGLHGRRWQFLVAVAAVGLLFVVLAIGNRSVDRVETGPEFATEPTATVTTPSSERGEDTAVQSTIISERGLGPTTVVDRDGDVVFVLGGALPAGVALDVVDLIEAELLALAVLGEQVPQRREAIADAGLVVQVGLDLDAQRRSSLAMETVPAGLDAVALTVDHVTGEIISAVSRSGSSLDVAQPAGSARIVTYAAAFELGFEPQSLINGRGPCEIQTNEGPVTIDNFGGSPGGLIFLSQQARRASRCAEARLETLASPAAIGELMQSMMGADIDGLIVAAPPVTAIEHVGAVAAVANDGKRPAVGFVSQISSADGDVVFERPEGTHVVSAETAREVQALMQANVERGTGVGAQLEGAASGGLTGSDTNFRAAWFVGSASGLSTAVWIAHPDGEPMVAIEGRNVTGGSFPADLWARIHEGFLAVRGPDALSDARPPIGCSRGYPIEVDRNDDGEVDGCMRAPADAAFERPTPATAVSNESCPASHPVPADIDGNGTSETCVTASFDRDAPTAHYATSIDVAMQTGQTAVERYSTRTTGRQDYVPGTLIHVGSYLSGNELVDLFRWRTSDAGPVALGRCLGTASQGVCEQVENPGTGPSTGGSGPTSENGVEIDPTYTFLLDRAPIGAKWFVVDTDLGARVIANVVGGGSIASWPSEAGGPHRLSVLGADHVELWSFMPD